VSLDGPPPPARPTAALDAFVQGIAVRSWVLARHQAGESGRADRLLLRGLERFRLRGALLPLAQWPLAWWSALLEDPGMLTPAEPGAGDPLRRLPPGPRAALLLRLVAGLDLPHAAQALGVSQGAHDAALEQALQAPGMDDARVEALRQRLHDAVHGFPGTERDRLVALLHGVMAPPEPLPDPSGPDTEADAAPPVAAAPGLPPVLPPPWYVRARQQRGALLLGALAIAALLVLAAWWPRPPVMAPGSHEALPAEAVGAPPPLDPAHVVTHPDYAQLAHPDMERLARDLAFFSWLAASTEAPVAAPAAPVASPPDNIPPAARELLAPVAGAWKGLDGESRARLLEQAADWQGRDAADRARVVQALRDWDRLPAPERARRREALVAWQQLGAGERAQVARAAARFATRSIAEQTDLRLQFGTLPDDTQHLWRLGPALGPELTAIAPMFAFAPEPERPALLAALRTLDLDARRNLALLAPRLGEAERDNLRRALVATPAPQRPALIAAQLAK
jgi:hypothetical protein